jgi:hypothetical protein
MLESRRMFADGDVQTFYSDCHPEPAFFAQ